MLLIERKPENMTEKYWMEKRWNVAALFVDGIFGKEAFLIEQFFVIKIL